MTTPTNPPTERLTAEALAELRKHLDKWNDQYDGYPASWNTVNALLADRDALEAERERLLNLVRYCRHELLDKDLITQDEFASILQEGSAAKLETYDQLRAQIAAADALHLATVEGKVALEAELQRSQNAHDACFRKVTTLEAELQEARAVRCPAILMHGLAANLIHRIMSVEVQCNPPTDVDLRLASIIAELQEAREQRDMLQRSLETRAGRELEMLEEVQKMVLDDFRSRLVAAVRARKNGYTVDVMSGALIADEDGPWFLNEDTATFIQSFNLVPDDVVTRLASPVHDEEPNL